MLLPFMLSLVFLPCRPLLAEAPPPPVLSLPDLKGRPEKEFATRFAFCVTGLVALTNARSFVLEGDGTRMRISLGNQPGPRPGDVLQVKGHTDLGPITKEKFLFATALEKVGSRPVPPVRDVSAKDLTLPEMDHARVRIRGCVVDVFMDEIDPHYIYMILNAEGESVYVTLPNARGTGPRLVANIGADVEITGVCSLRNAGRRMFVGHHVNADPQGLRILREAPPDPFDSPALEDVYNVSPTVIAGMSRRTVSGRVLATWRGNRLLLKTDDSRIVKVELADPKELPRYGQGVKIVGFPQTDLFHVNLSRAFCRVLDPSATAAREEAPVPVSVSDIISRTNDLHVIDTVYHGKLIRFTGIARTISSSPGNDAKINLESDGTVVPVDLSAIPDGVGDIPVGSEVEVTGICLMEGENWRPSMVFPTLGGFSLILRTASDLRVLTRPPWWTPLRLMLVILALFTALVTILTWNRALKRLVRERTEQLLREADERSEAELRADERTRLSVEVHDALSQSLSGVACQIAALRTFIRTNPDFAAKILEKAERMLLSCRTELRRCLSDLRANALDEPNLADAIRRTSAPAAGNATLDVRFDVAKTELSDSLAHTIICIIRELVSNAAQHGKATRILVAGECRKGEVTFSVSDNGIGFDPARRRSTEDGHFGLDGVQERVRRHDGSLSVVSRPGAGAKALVSFVLPDAARGGNAQP